MDGIICCLKNPQLVMDALYFTYDLKYGLVGPPMIYLVTEINKYQVRTGKSHWSMLSTQYVKNLIKTL